MPKLMAIAGLGWTALGVVSLIAMSINLRDDPGGMAAFGLMLNYVLFIVPGLLVTGIALIVIWRRSRRAGNREHPRL
jgi:hypothetical protein